MFITVVLLFITPLSFIISAPFKLYPLNVYPGFTGTTIDVSLFVPSCSLYHPVLYFSYISVVPGVVAPSLLSVNLYMLDVHIAYKFQLLVSSDVNLTTWLSVYVTGVFADCDHPANVYPFLVYVFLERACSTPYSNRVSGIFSPVPPFALYVI